MIRIPADASGPGSSLPDDPGATVMPPSYVPREGWRS
jgi:hypothetical protein